VKEGRNNDGAGLVAKAGRNRIEVTVCCGGEMEGTRGNFRRSCVFWEWKKMIYLFNLEQQFV
jgi:hypothetical protein